MSERSLHTQEVAARFEHDCDSCTFLGRDEDADVYACMQGGGLPTIILRRSHEPADYSSGAHYFDRLPRELQDGARAWLLEQSRVKLILRALREWAPGLGEIAVGDEVEHYQSGWSGPVTAIDGDQVTVRPMHPEPREKLHGSWSGWKPITVDRAELRKL